MLEICDDERDTVPCMAAAELLCDDDDAVTRPDMDMTSRVAEQEVRELLAMLDADELRRAR